MAIQQKLSLMIPGPTPVPEKVLQALSKHPIGHRSKEFQELVESTTKNLQWLHQTKNDVLTITGSGTAAMEAGIINTLSRGDKVICGENGKFGERWVKVAKAYGLEVNVVKADWGQPLDPNEFKRLLKEDRDGKILQRNFDECVRAAQRNAQRCSETHEHAEWCKDTPRPLERPLRHAQKHLEKRPERRPKMLRKAQKRIVKNDAQSPRDSEGSSEAHRDI